MNVSYNLHCLQIINILLYFLLRSWYAYTMFLNWQACNYGTLGKLAADAAVVSSSVQWR